MQFGPATGARRLCRFTVRAPKCVNTKQRKPGSGCSLSDDVQAGARKERRYSTCALIPLSEASAIQSVENRNTQVEYLRSCKAVTAQTSESLATCAKGAPNGEWSADASSARIAIVPNTRTRRPRSASLRIRALTCRAPKAFPFHRLFSLVLCLSFTACAPKEPRADLVILNGAEPES